MSIDNEKHANGSKRWWIDATFRLGVPTVFLAYLLYAFVNLMETLPARVDRMLEAVNNHASSTKALADEIIADNTKTLELLIANVELNKQNCMNNANTSFQRELCKETAEYALRRIGR